MNYPAPVRMKLRMLQIRVGIDLRRIFFLFSWMFSFPVLSSIWWFGIENLVALRVNARTHVITSHVGAACNAISTDRYYMPH